MSEEKLEQRWAEFIRSGHIADVSTCEFVRILLAEAAGIAEHFANDPLTIEEWPPCGLVEGERRFDDGKSYKTGTQIAKAIRALME